MDGIHVSVRLRPLSSSELSSGIHSCCAATSKSSLMITKEGDTTAYLKSQAASESEFAFDAVFDEHASQIEVYNKSAKPYVEKVIQGENVTIFAYGATGAGNEMTLNPETIFADFLQGAGIIPQAVADLFKLLHKRQEGADKGESWTVTMSYMEVYNEQVCDLLETSNKNLPLREDPDRGVVLVAGLSEFKVESYAQVLELLMKGQVNRKTEATKANIVSSRSHAILQFSVTHARRAGVSGNSTTEAKLSLIDLAGSERASATQNTGTRLQEGANINKSLLALANCINALSERSSVANLTSPRKGKKTNVKYRDSKLTHLLKGSLEGNCNLVMIANVNPADSTYDDTYRTLQYANRAKNLKVQPRARQIGTEAPAAEREQRLKEENEDLRQRLMAMEQNAQQSNQSEQQLLQALSQALVALNEAKAQSQSALVEGLPESCSQYTNAPALVVPTIPAMTALPSPAPVTTPTPVPSSAARPATAMPIWSSPKAPTPVPALSPTPVPAQSPTPVVHAATAVPAWSSPKTAAPAAATAAPAWSSPKAALSAAASAAPAWSSPKTAAPAAIPSPVPTSPMREDASAVLSGKKTKRDSTQSEGDRLSFSYNTRASTGSTMSIIYGADGEDDQHDENVPHDWRRESEDAKSRRTSLASSPRGGVSEANSEKFTRLSSSTSAGSRVQTRLSSSSVNGAGAGASGAPRTRAPQATSSAAASKPKRLSEELIQQYEVLANVTAAAIRRVSNADNTPAATSSEAEPLYKPGRGSFPSRVTGIDLNEPFDASKINIDARYRYSHGSRDATPPKQGFISRFLCGIKRR